MVQCGLGVMIGQPLVETPDRGAVSVTVLCASSGGGGGRKDPRSYVLERKLQPLLQNCIDLKQLCIQASVSAFQLRLNLIIISSSGDSCLFDAALLAAVTCLSSSTLPSLAPPLPNSFKLRVSACGDGHDDGDVAVTPSIPVGALLLRLPLSVSCIVVIEHRQGHGHGHGLGTLRQLRILVDPSPSEEEKAKNNNMCSMPAGREGEGGDQVLARAQAAFDADGSLCFVSYSVVSVSGRDRDGDGEDREDCDHDALQTRMLHACRDASATVRSMLTSI